MKYLYPISPFIFAKKEPSAFAQGFLNRIPFARPCDFYVLKTGPLLLGALRARLKIRIAVIADNYLFTSINGLKSG